jgi:hypothetical protein
VKSDEGETQKTGLEREKNGEAAAMLCSDARTSNILGVRYLIETALDGGWLCYDWELLAYPREQHIASQARCAAERAGDADAQSSVHGV